MGFPHGQQARISVTQELGVHLNSFGRTRRKFHTCEEGSILEDLSTDPERDSDYTLDPLVHTPTPLLITPTNDPGAPYGRWRNGNRVYLPGWSKRRPVPLDVLWRRVLPSLDEFQSSDPRGSRPRVRVHRNKGPSPTKTTGVPYIPLPTTLSREPYLRHPRIRHTPAPPLYRNQTRDTGTDPDQLGSLRVEGPQFPFGGTFRGPSTSSHHSPDTFRLRVRDPHLPNPLGFSVPLTPRTLREMGSGDRPRSLGALLEIQICFEKLLY